MVRVFLALLFAEPYELGWDTTVRLVKQPRGPTQYDYTVENADGRQVVYRTIEPMAPMDPNIHGKGTRVWKAVRLEHGRPCGAPVLLKDVWIHEELSREGQIMADIRRSDVSKGAQEVFARTLLTVVDDGDVKIHPSTGPNPPHLDCTRLHASNARAYQYAQPYLDSRFEPPNLSRDFSMDSVTESRAIEGRKVHYRIVFKELCTTLHAKTPLHVIGKALRDICEGEYPAWIRDRPADHRV